MRTKQCEDLTIAALKRCVVERVAAKNCNVRSLQQFKRYWNKFRVVSDLCVFDKNGHEVIVLPFDFLVDVVFKIHTKMAHIGRHKLEKMIMNKFFHPSIKKIIKDVTRSCTHCQLYEPRLL
jgi:hypothetical protein